MKNGEYDQETWILSQVPPVIPWGFDSYYPRLTFLTYKINVTKKDTATDSHKNW